MKSDEEDTRLAEGKVLDKLVTVYKYAVDNIKSKDNRDHYDLVRFIQRRYSELVDADNSTDITHDVEVLNNTLKYMNCNSAAELLSEQFNKNHKIPKWYEDSISICKVVGEIIHANGPKFVRDISNIFYVIIDKSSRLETFLTKLPEEVSKKYNIYSMTVKDAVAMVHGDGCELRFGEGCISALSKLLYEDRESLEKYVLDRTKQVKIIRGTFNLDKSL